MIHKGDNTMAQKCISKQFIENEMEILEGYNFSYFCGKYMPDKYYKWAFILLSSLLVLMFPGLREDAFKSLFFYILVGIIVNS